MNAPRILMIVAVGALVLLVWQLTDLLLLVFGGIVLGAALRALAAPAETYLHLSARRSVVLVVLVVVTSFILGAWVMGERFAAEFADLRQRVPEAAGAVVDWLRKQPLGAEILDSLDEARQGELPWGRFTNLAGTTLGALGSASLVAILAIYLALDPDLYRKGFVRLVPQAYRQPIDEALTATGDALLKWLKGQGISMLFVGATTAIGLAVLQIPLALSVGVVAGVLAFIPFFGPIASGVLATVLAFMQGPEKALYVALLCVAIQQVEGNILMPLIQRWAVALPPVLGILAAVMFGMLFGIVGVLFATPLMVVVMVLVQKLYIDAFLEPS